MSSRPFLIPMLAAAAVLAACSDNETAIARGDRLWADSNYTAALAEYRLAYAQRGDDPARYRLAHAYARAGQLEEARDLYRELLVGYPGFTDQAAYDFMEIAERAARRGDGFTTSAALEAAHSLRPELPAPTAVLPVARVYRQRGDPERAAYYYARALATLPPDSAPRLLYEMGLLHEETGRCDLAVDHFRAAQTQAQRQAARWRTLLGEARWRLGNCSFRLARDARARGDDLEALSLLGDVVRLGQPEHLLDQAWMERADIHFDMGRYDEALDGYRRVVDRSPSRTGPLVQRAQERIDAIRFGRVDEARGDRGALNLTEREWERRTARR